MAVPIYKNKGTQKAFIKITDSAGKQVDFDTTVFIDADPGYSPEGKSDPDPEKLPKYYQGDTNLRITWFTDFGVNGPTNPANPKKLQKAYKVTLQRAPAGKTLCIYDDTQTSEQKVLVLSPTAGSGRIAYIDNNNGTISFYLDLVDPPSGFYP
jgi:hypothetical protein